MEISVSQNRAAIRRLVASAGASNPRLREPGQGSILEILVDPRPGIRPADLQQLQINLEEVLRAQVAVLTPANLGARQRAAALLSALPI